MLKPSFYLICISLFAVPQDFSNELESLAKINPKYAEFLETDSSLKSSNEPDNKDRSVDGFSKVDGLDSPKSRIFGFDFIKDTPRSISSTSDLPVPSDYILSSGDKLRVILTGAKKDSILLTVGLDGSILFPELGEINVFGDSLADAKDKISKIIEISYVGTEASVSLDKLAAKKINIVGAVKNPGTYIVNPFSTVFSSLSYSGGFEDYASLRNITLKRGNEILQYDLYDLLIYGNNAETNIQQGDTIIVNSTTNLVDIGGEVRRPFIYEFKSTDTFRKLVDDFSMGATDFGNSENIYVEILSKNKLSNTYVDLDEPINDLNLQKIKVFKNAVVEDLDIEIIGKSVQQKLLSASNYSTLSEVINDLAFSDDLYPFYATIEQSGLNNLFKSKKSFSIYDMDTYSNISLTKNTKIRFYSREDIEDIQEAYFDKYETKSTEEEERKNYESFNTVEERVAILETRLNLLNNQTKENVDTEERNNEIEYLDDGIFFSNENDDFLSREEVEEIKEEKERIDEILSSISIKSFKNFFAFKNKQALPIEGKVSVELLVNFFGINEDHNIQNSSISMADGSTVSDPNNLVRAEQIISIYVPVINFETSEVTINGLVKAPGKYNVPIGTTLDTLYQIAGGLDDAADIKSIIMTRESIKQSEQLALESSKKVLTDAIFSSVGNSASLGNSSAGGNLNQLAPLLALANQVEPVGRLTGNLAPNSLFAKSILIEDGDVITIIPERITVTVVGQVLQPITVAYNNVLDIEDYISLSGGYTDYADKKNIYIISKDGTSKPFNKKYFQRGEAILPGDTIVIPRDMQKVSTIPLVSLSTRIISDIAFAAASLNSIRN